MGGLFLAVMPVRTYLTQRQTMASVSSRLHHAQNANSELTAEISQLNSASQIAQIARTRFGLVMPGQESYVILPNSTTGGQPDSVPQGAALVGAAPATTAAPTTTLPKRPSDSTKPTH